MKNRKGAFQGLTFCLKKRGPLNNSKIFQIGFHCPTPTSVRRKGGCSKRPVNFTRPTPARQDAPFLGQGRRAVGARSVHVVREHDNGPRTPLADFFNSPKRPVWLWVCVLVIGWGGFVEENYGASDQPPEGLVLEDFSHPDEQGFPQNWEAQRSKTTAKETYTIGKEDGGAFLSAKGATQRVYTKHISWHPKEKPILKWRWRVHSIPEDSEFVAVIYPSLDVDLLFIPVHTKYIWSQKESKGTIKEGGFFRPTEIVIRSGSGPVGEWIEEQVNVYEDFKQIHQHEPAQQAWGISLLAGPGVEIDFGPLTVHAP